MCIRDRDGFAVFGGAVLDFEDFLVSNLFLPLGSLVYLSLIHICTLEKGMKELQKILEQKRSEGKKEIDGKSAFYLYDTFGFPLELLSLIHI